MHNVDKLPYSASMQMAKIANEMRAQGKSVINLGIGDTHFSVPEPIQKAFAESLNNDKAHYSAAQGIIELRKEISKKYNGAYEPNQIVITHGVKNGMHAFMAASDIKKVVVLEPAWLGYHSIIQLTNKELVRINYLKDNWLEELEQADFDALMICSPNNPTGHVISKEQVEKILEITEGKNALVLIDEIYEKYNFSKDNSVEAFYGKENVVVFNGFSKSHAATGLRLGYALFRDADVMDKMVRIQQHSITCPSTLAQYAFINFIDSEEEVQRISNYYNENMQVAIKEFPFLEKYTPSGGFYFFVDLSEFGVANAQEFCLDLLEQKGVTLVHGAAYGEGFDSWARISFSVDRDQLIEGLNRIKSYLQSQ